MPVIFLSLVLSLLADKKLGKRQDENAMIIRLLLLYQVLESH
jgi:hypothetical protein